MKDQFKTQLASKLIEQKGKLQSNRGNFENVWQQISEFVLPNRGDFTFMRAKGARADFRVFDTTAIQANEMLAAALHSGLTNPAARWFDLRPRDPSLLDNDNVKKWIDEVLRIMFKTFDSSIGNFYQQNHELLLDLVAYGTACMYVDEETGVGIRFNTRHLSEIYIVENSKGSVDTIYRCFKFTARQAEQEFGEDKLSPQVRSALASEPHKEFTFMHIVMPRKDAQRMDASLVEGIPENRKFVGMYVCEDDKAVINTAGFYEMPYIVVRWEKLIAESYGRSPAWNSLSDIRMINVMSETIIRAAQKQVDPPLLVADDGVVMPMRTHPSGTNVGGVSADGKPLIQPLQTGGNLSIGIEMMEQRREAIRQAYFVDQFIPKQGTPVTATEAIQNQENRLRLTGPQVGRIQAEYLAKLIDRVFGILLRANAFPPAPSELDGVDLDIEYVSPMVKQQRVAELMALNRAIDSASGYIQYKPDILDNLDGDEFFRGSLDVAGVPARYIKNKKIVEADREERAKQQEQMQQAAMLKEGADSAAKLKSAGFDIGE